MATDTDDSANEPTEKKKLVITESDLEAEDRSSDVTQPLVVTPSAKDPTKPKASKAKGMPKPFKKGPAGLSRPDSDSWLGRHAGLVVAIAGGVATVAVGFVIAFVVLGLFDSSEAKTRDALLNAKASFDEIASGVTAASGEQRYLTELKTTSRDADGEVDAIGTEIDALKNDVDDGQLVNPAIELMVAQQDFLGEINKIARFKEGSLYQQWRGIRPKLRQAQNRVNAAAGKVDALALDTDAPMAPTAEEMDQTIDGANAVLARANKTLDRYRSKLNRYRQVSSQGLADAQSYRNQMESLIDQYFDQRDETRALMNECCTFWTVAGSELGRMASARESIINGMNSLLVPDRAVGPHQTMVGLAQESKAILDQARVDIESNDPDIIWQGSAGYNRMDSASNAITDRFGPARESVLSAADTAIREIQQAKPPKKPLI